jgi:hypothetical protein
MDTGTSLPGRRPVPLWLPLLLALIAAVALLVIPTAQEETVLSSPTGGTVRSSPTGGTVRSARSMTLVQSQGPHVLIPLAIPVVLAGIPLAFGWTRPRRVTLIVAGLLLLIFVVLSLPSIGMFYLPATVAMLAAAKFNGP